MAQKNECCVWDFTYHVEEESADEVLVKDVLIEHCKKWCFQLERGERTGKIHFQGRVSLIKKCRLPKFLKGAHWACTSKENMDNEIYVSKVESRIRGPWTDRDKYIPRQVRGLKMRSWQQHVIDDVDVWDTRSINLIYDSIGNIGKSTLVTYMGCHGLGEQIPFVNNYKDLLRVVYSVPAKCYLIDMPRACSKDNLFQLYGAIETIKGGFAFDDRYEYKKRYFDCPNVWVFSNKLPDPDLYSRDRWRIWIVDSNGDLVRKKNISDLIEEILKEDP